MEVSSIMIQRQYIICHIMIHHTIENRYSSPFLFFNYCKILLNWKLEECVVVKLFVTLMAKKLTFVYETESLH